MSHHVDSMAYYGSTPWHRLGKKVDQAMTAAEAIDAAGLNWRVEKRPVTYTPADGQPARTMPGKFVTVRADKGIGLGVVGDQYTPLQNREAFGFFDAVVQEKLAIYHTCGSLKDGQTIWILAKLPQTVKVLGVDPLDAYTLLWNTHDGSSSVCMQHTAVRVVCWNTLNMARGAAGARFTFRHSAAVGDKVRQAREALGIATQTMGDMLAAVEHLARTKLNASMVEEFLKGIDLHKITDESTRRENQRMDVLRLIETGYGHRQDAIRGSLWTAVNAVTEYVDHAKGGRNDENKLASAWFGHGAALKNTAFETALALAK